MLFAFLSTAHAVVYVGSPTLGFRVDRAAGDYTGSSVVLDKVRVHHCAGGYTDVQVDETLDLVDGATVSIPSGDHCGLTWYWDSALDIDGPTYTVRYAQATTGVTLDDEIPPVALTPYTVVSGTMSGGGPWLLSSID
jgi:hypothetical protein